MKSIPKTCALENCENDRKSLGLCYKHYSRQRRGADLHARTSRDHRPAIFKDGNCLIPVVRLSSISYAKVDKNLSYLDRYKWNSGKYGYAVTAINGKAVRMHHLVIGKPVGGMVVDHINGDRLDNRRSNLRFATPRQNIYNSKSQVGSLSKYKGVSYDRARAKYTATISINGKLKFIGRFEDEEEAARKYDEYARRYRGEFAYLNNV